MAFDLPPETRRLSWLIYAFGAGGVISRLFGIPPPKLIDAGFDLSSLAPTYIAGLFGVATIFLTISFFLRAVLEFTRHRLRLAEHAMHVLATTSRATALTGEIPVGRDKEPLVVEIVETQNRLRKVVVVFGGFAAILEVAFPLIFGLVCILVLWHPALHFLEAVVMKAISG